MGKHAFSASLAIVADGLGMFRDISAKWRRAKA
jgi:hypothetical protein